MSTKKDEKKAAKADKNEKNSKFALKLSDAFFIMAQKRLRNSKVSCRFLLADASFSSEFREF